MAMTDASLMRGRRPAVMLEEDRHWWFATRTDSLLGMLDRLLPEAAGGRVLDVGCGAGNMFHHLARYGAVEGLDNSPKPLAIARQRGATVVTVEDAFLRSVLPGRDRSRIGRRPGDRSRSC